MATAPRPGAGKRLELDAEIRAELDSGFKITCGRENRTVEILIGDLDSEDELACLRETGFTPQDLVGQTMNHTGVLVFYWLGVRKLKDPRPLKKILAKYGSMRKFLEADFEAWGLGRYADLDDEGDEEAEAPTADPTQPEEPSEPPGPSGPASTDSTPGTSEVPPS